MNKNQEVFKVINCELNIDPRYIIGDNGTVINTNNNRVIKVGYVNGKPSVQLKLVGNECRNYRKFPVNLLVASTFVEKEYDELRGIRHIDGDVNNLHYKNLEWTFTNYNVNSSSDRKIDLTIYQVKTICEYLEEGLPYKGICELAGIDYNEYNRTILSKIKNGELFDFISEDYDINRKVKMNVKYSNNVIDNICKSIANGERKIDIARRVINDPYADSSSKEINSILSTISKIHSRIIHTEISMNYQW